MLSQNENLDLKWAAAPSLGPGAPAHRQQSRQTPRLEPTAPASRCSLSVQVCSTVCDTHQIGDKYLVQHN